MSAASRYADFAEREARGVSPVYERLSFAISCDEEILALLHTVPEPKRQPNLLLGVVRLLGGPVDEPAAFHDFTVSNWAAIAAELGIRATQTNEAGRCALLLPVLAMLPQPLAPPLHSRERGVPAPASRATPDRPATRSTACPLWRLIDTASTGTLP